MKSWQNWSGSVAFCPATIEHPHREEDVQALVEYAASRGQNVRTVGSGHSSSPLVETPDILLDLSAMNRLIAINQEDCTATFEGGVTIEDAGPALAEHGFQLHNIGDIDKQHLVGAFATGTHGSGARLQNLSAMLTGCRIAGGDGTIHTFNDGAHAAMMRALRVSLGAMGVFTEITVRVKPIRQYIRREYCTSLDALQANLDELIATHDMFDFYWYPREDRIKIRTCHPADDHSPPLPFAEEQPDRRREGPLHKVLPKNRTMKFEEMEYALPAEAGPECFAAVRERIMSRHRDHVWWRILYRTVAADDAFLSPFSGRDCVTIAILQNVEQPYEAYFRDMEPVLRDYDGRPHWGKKNFLPPSRLAALYPQWENFSQTRAQMDPEGIFLNRYLRALFQQEA